MTDSDRPNLANAQVTGGGGHEPDPDEQPGGAAVPAEAADGVDLKTEHLPDQD
jgi:hypothetical protein